MASVTERSPPSTAAIAIATGIVAALGGYFVGQASSLGLFGSGSKTTQRSGRAEDDDDDDDDSSDGEDEDLGPVEQADLKDFAGLNEECKLVLVVRTDLGMTKGESRIAHGSVVRTRCCGRRSSAEMSRS